MGIYTNYTGEAYSSTRYTDVAPFVGENFNYHELGIMAAAEISANHNAFMKSIALSELAAVEQTGSTDVLYESVNIKGIFEKIKMFFKKIIEKIHKIFHTFIAKMSSWFGGNASFAKNYEKEVIKGWANVSNDWEFKGYIYKLPSMDTTSTETIKVDIENVGDRIKGIITDGDLSSLNTALDDADITKTDEEIRKIRSKMDDIKDYMRKQVINSISSKNWTFDVKVSNTGGGYDSSEYTEELFKLFRSGEDSKIDMDKSKITDSYDGSITGMMTYIKDFDKIKKKTETAERKLTNAIDALIKKVDKAQNEILKNNKTETDKAKKKTNELTVQASSLFQSIYGALSEIETQAFSALLQAQKDACVQAKEIAVKVIGQSKKMTESYDYSDSSYDGGFDFISSVKLV